MKNDPQQTAPPNEIKQIFTDYKNSIFSIQNDLEFWRGFLDRAIKDYPLTDNSIYSSLFHAYDYDYSTNSGYLCLDKEAFKIQVPDLNNKREEFFGWIMNLSVLRAYNSIEILLLRSIQKSYYPTMEDPITGKKQTDLVQNEIKKYLKSNSLKISTKNNEHILEFLKHKEPKIKTFVNHYLNVDLKTNWENFFRLLSLLRNIIVHHGMIIQPDIHNVIKSKAKDVFQRFFSLKESSDGHSILFPTEKDFRNLITYINSLTLTLYKLIFGENSYDFIGLISPDIKNK